jgi:pimeloyl-ACP methyl ester carboxylesterase
MEVLNIPDPVLVGHSLAGGELTTLGAQHSDLLSGLIYLDAGADPIDSPWNNLAYRQGVEKVTSMNPPPTSAADAYQTHQKDSVAAYQEWQTDAFGFAFSESEIRSMYEVNPDGSIGMFRARAGIGRLIDAGAKRRDYRGITVPVLSIFAMPDPPADGWADRSQEYRDAARLVDETLTSILRGSQRQLKESVPSARILKWPGASHFLFITQEEEVVREIRDFVAAHTGELATK